ncbi:hypothetical protein [Streptomyces sp. NPDC051219]|uniref:hypothetical protein n=1 Tax=Streptomyces sp. NPDC051219 TaxID=3155283 RepID=UPI00341DEEB2
MRSAGKLTFLLNDHHGTGTTQISADAAQVVTRRKSAIYGDPRGAQPSAWVGDKGFVGGTKDADTGLTPRESVSTTRQSVVSFRSTRSWTLPIRNRRMGTRTPTTTRSA